MLHNESKIGFVTLIVSELRVSQKVWHKNNQIFLRKMLNKTLITYANVKLIVLAVTSSFEHFSNLVIQWLMMFLKHRNAVDNFALPKIVLRICNQKWPSCEQKNKIEFFNFFQISKNLSNAACLSVLWLLHIFGIVTPI